MRKVFLIEPTLTERDSDAEALCKASKKWNTEARLRKYPPYLIDRASIKGFTVCREFLLRERFRRMNREQKEKQIRREARATLLLFIFCFVWNVGFAYGLSGSGIRFFGLPLWWLISTPGMFVIAVIGVIVLIKRVFADFDLDEEEEGGLDAE